MPSRKKQQKEAVEKRAQEILDEKTERRRLAAQVAAGTRRERRAQQQAETGPQAGKKRATRARSEPKERKPRVHADLLTVAYRGPLANRFRELADQHHLSLAKLLQDALLSYEASVAAGYQPGTALSEWRAQQGQEAAGA